MLVDMTEHPEPEAFASRHTDADDVDVVEPEDTSVEDQLDFEDTLEDQDRHYRQDMAERQFQLFGPEYDWDGHFGF